MAFGAPRMYTSPEDLQKSVNEYFEYIKGVKYPQGDWERAPEPATVTGLALYLGFESRQSIYDYEKSGDFSYIVKNARMRVECEYEKKLSTMHAPAGAIFALKNMGWKDKFETELYGKDGQPLAAPVFKLPDGTSMEI
jgi:DNA-packaging protein gp3